ncbi:MAG: hypothetical protein WA459_17845 [Stellaceae bacterium]
MHWPRCSPSWECRRREGRARARGSAIYTSSYAIGTAGSFLLSGVVDARLGWRASFVASGIAPLLAVAAIGLLPTTSERLPAAAVTLDFRRRCVTAP